MSPFAPQKPEQPAQSADCSTVVSHSELVDKCITRTNWLERCSISSSLNGARACWLVDRFMHGRRNVVRTLEFDDGRRWVARVQLAPPTEESAIALHQMVAAMTVVCARSDAPVPIVYAIGPDGGPHPGRATPIGSAYILMEYLPGISALAACAGAETTTGELLRQFRPAFSTSVGQVQIQIASIRFAKIGGLARLDNGSFEVVALPGIGGPFDNAVDFFEAWAQQAEFPHRDRDIYERHHGASLLFANDLVASIRSFTPRIHSEARHLRLRGGPFPLCHRGIANRNVVVDAATFNLLGVVGWDGAAVLPWEMVTLPAHVQTEPVGFGLPWDYGLDGEPLGEDIQSRRAEQDDYLDSLHASELDVAREWGMQVDHMLSSVLLDPKSRDLAYALAAFEEGKVGFYGKVLDKIQDK